MKKLTNRPVKKVNHPAFMVEDITVDLPDDEIHTSIQVKVPRSYFRILSEPAVSVCMANIGKNWYLFAKKVIDAYPGRIKYMSHATLYLGMTESDEVFLLPVTEPWRGYPASWRDSLLEAIETTSSHWIKIAADQQEQRYDIVDKKRARTEPDWPNMSFEEILQEAFAGELYVGSVDHPVLDELVD